MTSDELALLAAICAKPAEDMPRLAYADCIEEQSQCDRAAFIRVQVELAKMPACHVVEGHIIEFSSKPVPLRVVALVNRRDVRLQETTTLRHQNRDDSWYTIPGLRIHQETEFDSERVRVTFLQTGAHDSYEDRRAELCRRERELWPKQMVLWGTEVGDYHRGFLRTWQGTAADFLTHADALIWSGDRMGHCPGCHKCKGGAIYTVDDGSRWTECRQPRLCPPTAQPIEHVTLTTLPPLKYEFAGGDTPRFAHLPGRADKKVQSFHNPRSDAREVMEAAYPGIKFKIGVRDLGPTIPALGELIEMLRRVR